MNAGEPPTMPKHLSPSSAGLFEQCELRWRYRYVERLPDPPGIEALAGTFAHRVLELLLAEPPARRTVGQARLLARDVWPTILAHEDFAALDLDADAERSFRWRSWQAIEGLWTIEDPAGVEVRSTELRVRTDLDGVPFMGVIDRVDVGSDGLVVSDYKSGRPPAPRFEGDKLSQVLLYAAALAAAEGVAPVRVRLLYLGSRAIEAEVTPEVLDHSVGSLRGTWERLAVAVEADSFTAKPGPLCGWCAYADRCPSAATSSRPRGSARGSDSATMV